MHAVHNERFHELMISRDKRKRKDDELYLYRISLILA